MQTVLRLSQSNAQLDAEIGVLRQKVLRVLRLKESKAEIDAEIARLRNEQQVGQEQSTTFDGPLNDDDSALRWWWGDEQLDFFCQLMSYGDEGMMRGKKR